MSLLRRSSRTSVRSVRFVILFVALCSVAVQPVRAEDCDAPDGITGVPTNDVTVAAVQFEISEERFASVSRLRTEIDRLVTEARERFDADIVVFPEYINVFLLASRYPGVLAESQGLFEALAGISDAPVDDETVAEVLHSHAHSIAETAIAMWSAIADRHDVTVVAGTLFALAESDDTSDAPADDAPELRNRLLVFGKDGRLVYTQDKVYLTPVESEVLGIEPGSIGEAVPLVVDGLEVGFTICRDGYFSAWNRTLGGVDLWISVRANGERYTREVYERFLTAMPERVAETDVDAGISASLTGEFLGEVWAGPSYVVDESGERIAASDLPVGTQITAVRMVRADGEWRPQPVDAIY